MSLQGEQQCMVSFCEYVCLVDALPFISVFEVWC